MEKYENYYAILGVPQCSPMDRVRKSYRELAKAYHPDRNAGDPECEEKLMRLNIAFRFLSDPDQKSLYDRELSEPVKPVSARPAAVSEPGHPHASPGSSYRTVAINSDTYEQEPRRGSKVGFIASISALVLISFGLLAYSAIRQDRLMQSGSALDDMRNMGLLPSLHTGLLAGLTGHGPGQLRHDYYDQLGVLIDSTSTEISNADQTLAELRARDDAAGSPDDSADGASAGPVAIQRKAMENLLSSQIDTMRSRINSTTSEIKNFPWSSPGLRAKLRASTIDSDLKTMDDSLEPIHDTNVQAQALLLQSDHTPGEEAPAPK